MPFSLVLASSSVSRKTLLTNAGISFLVDAPELNEQVLHEDPSFSDPRTLALALSEEKARIVWKRHENAWVVGADQVFSCEGKIFHKPQNLAQARQTLLQIRGHTHHLYTAITCLRPDGSSWSHCALASLTMREFSDSFLDRYLSLAGESLLESPGAYRLESLGVQLFEKIEGNFFTILGLPLLPFLAFLRAEGVVQS